MSNERILQLQSLIQIDPSDPFLHYGLALEWMKQEDYKKAKDTFQYLIEKHPSYLATYYQLGKLLADLEEIDQATAILSAGSNLAKAQNNLKTKGEIDTLLWEIEED